MSIKSKIYKLFYPAYKIYLYIFRPQREGSGVIITYKDEILLVKNTYGDQRWWSFPGGGIKKDESAESAAKREIQEEVGIKVNGIKKVGSFKFTEYFHNDIVYVFTAEVGDKNIILDKDEIWKAKWLPAIEIRDVDLSDIGILMFRMWKESINKKL